MAKEVPDGRGLRRQHFRDMKCNGTVHDLEVMI